MMTPGVNLHSFRSSRPQHAPFAASSAVSPLEDAKPKVQDSESEYFLTRQTNAICIKFLIIFRGFDAFWK
jgi:hypothetical protein